MILEEERYLGVSIYCALLKTISALLMLSEKVKPNEYGGTQNVKKNKEKKKQRKKHKNLSNVLLIKKYSKLLYSQIV